MLTQEPIRRRQPGKNDPPGIEGRSKPRNAATGLLSRWEWVIYLEKLRVYQVAKEKKLSSDALISMLKTLNYDVKSHMSVVDEEMLAAIAKKIDAEKKSSIQEVQRQKVKEETRKKAEPRPPRPATSASTSQPAR